MPWPQVTPMDHRLQFVAEARRTDESFTALCDRYGVAPVWRLRPVRGHHSS